MSRNDLLDLRHDVVDRLYEPSRMGANALVLAKRELDQIAAAQTATLAAKGRRGIFLPRPATPLDRFVDLTEERLLRTMRSRASSMPRDTGSCGAGALRCATLGW